MLQYFPYLPRVHVLARLLPLFRQKRLARKNRRYLRGLITALTVDVGNAALVDLLLVIAPCTRRVVGACGCGFRLSFAFPFLSGCPCRAPIAHNLGGGLYHPLTLARRGFGRSLALCRLLRRPEERAGISGRTSRIEEYCHVQLRSFT